MVTDPAKPLEFTGKNTTRRQVGLAAYADEIDALYARVEQSSQIDLSPPADWSMDSARSFIKEAVKRIMRMPTLGDEDDIFVQGCDR